MSNWREMIDAARSENERGIEVRRGKKYTTVAIRVEIARRFLGGTIGIETEIVEYGRSNGEPVVVRAIIRDTASGQIVGSGTAEEIRGKGQVNATSALENAETSAIGRALASMGLSGGEFASANEMDAAERKAEAKSDAESNASGEARKATPSERNRMLAEATAKIVAAATLSELEVRAAWFRENRPAIAAEPAFVQAEADRRAELSRAAEIEAPF